MWKIIPLDVGNITFDQSEFTLRRGMGQKVLSKFIAWLVTDGKTNILVDTGLPDMEIAVKYHSYTSPTRTEEQKLENALLAQGVKVSDLSMVLLTHLHWDHAGGLDTVKGIPTICADKELRYAVKPIPPNYAAYDAPQPGKVFPAYLRLLSQIETIPMEETEIVPGIKMIPTPGHTPGSMSVVVETEGGNYVIAGDAVNRYENVAGDPEKGLQYLPMGVYGNLIEVWESYERIMKYAGGRVDHVLPGHEDKVFEHESYPVL